MPPAPATPAADLPPLATTPAPTPAADLPHPATTPTPAAGLPPLTTTPAPTPASHRRSYLRRLHQVLQKPPQGLVQQHNRWLPARAVHSHERPCRDPGRERGPVGLQVRRI